MRKTFCDRCGVQCVNTVVHLHGAIEHTTSRGENVGHDEIRPVELCDGCYGLVKELVGLTEIPQERDMSRAEMPLAPVEERRL